MLLLIPFDQKLDWKKPPVVTIALVLINILVFLMFQLDENDKAQVAIETYFESGLDKIEFPAYEKFLRSEKRASEISQNEIYMLFQLNSDPGFRLKIDNDQVITQTNPNFDKWRTNRKNFDREFNSITSQKYGYKTAEPKVLTAFTHMFLHGGFGHLLGNMFFLFAVGFLVEATIGKLAYLGLYLLCGIGSVLFYQVLGSPSLITGIGASGAISGVMGMYTVLYWLRPIRFFYFIFVFFSTIRLPALVMLPLWVGNEIYSILQYPESNTNYLAHIGGYISGAILGLLAMKFLKSYDMSFYEKNTEAQAFNKAFEVANELCEELEFKKAYPLLKKIERDHPNNSDVLFRLQQCVRLRPDSEEFHKYSHKLFLLEDTGMEPNMRVHGAFKHYMSSAKPKPNLNRAEVHALAKRFIVAGKLTEAEYLVKLLLHKNRMDQDATIIVEKLAAALDRSEQSEKAGKYRAAAKELLSSDLSAGPAAT